MIRLINLNSAQTGIFCLNIVHIHPKTNTTDLNKKSIYLATIADIKNNITKNTKSPRYVIFSEV
ncbi:hypothetical protein SedNR2807_34390 [Citrobacter sedlakii]